MNCVQGLSGRVTTGQFLGDKIGEVFCSYRCGLRVVLSKSELLRCGVTSKQWNGFIGMLATLVAWEACCLGENIRILQVIV